MDSDDERSESGVSAGTVKPGGLSDRGGDGSARGDGAPSVSVGPASNNPPPDVGSQSGGVDVVDKVTDLHPYTLPFLHPAIPT